MRLRAGGAAARRAAATLGMVLNDTLHLLHPVTPFVTEHLHSRLLPAMDRKGLWGEHRPESGPAADSDAPLLARSAFPASGGVRDPQLEERFDALRRLVSALRKLRADAGLPPDLRLPVIVRESRGLPGFGALAQDCGAPLTSLARLASLSALEDGEAWPAPPARAAGARTGHVSIVDPAFEARTNLGAAGDLESVRQRIETQLDRVASERERTGKRLGNPGFLAGADPGVVQSARERMAVLDDQVERLAELMTQLKRD